MSRWPFYDVQFTDETPNEPSPQNPHPRISITADEWEQIKTDALAMSVTSRAYARLYAAMVRCEAHRCEVVDIFDAADVIATAQAPGPFDLRTDA